MSCLGQDRPDRWHHLSSAHTLSSIVFQPHAALPVVSLLLVFNSPDWQECALPNRRSIHSTGSLRITGREFEGISIHENWVSLHTRGWKGEGGGWRWKVKMEGGRGGWKVRMEGEESSLRMERVEMEGGDVR